jgi:protein-serine/threonine kinase
MSAISSTSYILPPRRPWDPSRFLSPDPVPTNGADHGDTRIPDANHSDSWPTGNIVKGHPNICPLLDFFEDNHYYHLVLPSTLPEQAPGDPPPPSDLFDLIENYPQGLPPSSIRSYLGQIADALAFLHEHGIGEFLPINLVLRTFS